MNSSQIKSRERVSQHGEVFTAEREVKAMCDLVSRQCSDYKATFLEPACGDGNFLAEILSRKLHSIESDPDYVTKSLIALSSLYGIDIQQDNVDACIKRLYELWEKSGSFEDKIKIQARLILNNNIVCGDFLKPKTITLHDWEINSQGTTPLRGHTLDYFITGQGELDFR
ncbi:MAG: hypothetical protein IJT58_03150 [Synergistaceae bacterium]|nr:hypothetical protein [Synergistaceae bacterium]